MSDTPVDPSEKDGSRAEVPTPSLDAPAASEASDELTQQSAFDHEELKRRLPVVVWSSVAVVAFIWYLETLPFVWSLVIAAAQLVLFILATIGGYYGWTRVQNLFVERELLVNEIERQHDMKSKLQSFNTPSTTRGKLASLDAETIESVLSDWNIAPEVARGGSKLLYYIVRDFILTWYNGFISTNEEFPKATAVVIIKAVGKFSNRCRLCATTEYKRLWILDGIIKILAKKINWYRTMRNNAEEENPALFEEFHALKPGDYGTAHFFERLEKVKQAVIHQYKKEKYLHPICGEDVDDGKGGFKKDTSRREEYFRHIVVRVMRLLLEPSETGCESGFAIVREVMACKVFPFLPSVLCSRNMNGWIHLALKKIEARRLADKSGRAGGSSEPTAAATTTSDTVDELRDESLQESGAPHTPEVPPVICCLAAEDLDLFYSSNLATLVLAGDPQDLLNLSTAKTSKREALGALEGESCGSFLIRVVDSHYLAISVVVTNSNQVQHCLVRAIAGKGYQVEEPAQSTVHSTLLATLQSLDAPLYQLIRQERPKNAPVVKTSSPRGTTSPSTLVHSHFKMTIDQLHSLNSVVKTWQGGQTRIEHIPFQVSGSRQQTNANATSGEDTDEEGLSSPSGDQLSQSVASPTPQAKNSSAGAKNQLDPQELVNKLAAHVEQALPLSFAHSITNGIDLNCPEGNAVTAAVHAVLESAMIVTLDKGRVDGSVDGVELLVPDNETETDSPATVVSYAVLLDRDLARVVVEQHSRGESVDVDEAVCIHLIARSIRDKDGAIKKVFEQARTRMGNNFSTTNTWESQSALCTQFTEQLELIEGAMMCHYTPPKLLTEKLRNLKELGRRSDVSAVGEVKSTHATARRGSDVVATSTTVELSRQLSADSHDAVLSGSATPKHSHFESTAPETSTAQSGGDDASDESESDGEGDGEHEIDTLGGAAQRNELVDETARAVDDAVAKFCDHTVPLSEIEAHGLVLAVEKVLLHGYHGFRKDVAAWLHAVFAKYEPENLQEVPALLEEMRQTDEDKIILKVALRFPGVETPAQLGTERSNSSASSRRLLSSPATRGSNAVNETPKLRSFFQLGSASARWARIYAYLCTESLDANLSQFLSEESLFISQHFDESAVILSRAHIQELLTTYQMALGVQFARRPDSPTEANGAFDGPTKSLGGDIVLYQIPDGLKTGDKFTYEPQPGEKLIIKVPPGKTGGDTLVFKFQNGTKRRKKKRTKRSKRKGNQSNVRRPTTRQVKSPAADRGRQVGPGGARRRPLRDQKFTWDPQQIRNDVSAGGTGGKLSATITGHQMVSDSRPESLAEPYTVYVIRVIARDAHGDPLTSWKVRRRYQYFRNLFLTLKDLQPRLRVECPKQHAFRRVFGGDQFFKRRIKELNKFLVDILDEPTLREAHKRRPIYEFLSRDVIRRKVQKPRGPNARKMPNTSTASTLDQKSSLQKPRINTGGAEGSTTDHAVGSGQGSDVSAHASTPSSSMRTSSGYGRSDKDQYAVTRREVKVTFELCIQLMEEIFRVKEKHWAQRTTFDAAINLVKNTVIFNSRVFPMFREQHTNLFSTTTLGSLVDMAVRIGWPGGVLLKPKEDPTLDEQAALRLELKQMLKKVPPKSVTNLIGKKTAHGGLDLLWEFLQYEDLIHDALGTVMDVVVQQFEDLEAEVTNP